MSSKNHLLVLLLAGIYISFLSSCTDEAIVIDSNEAIHTLDTCSGNLLHSYEVYIPANAKSCVQLPLIIILDPHADGKSAINYFQPAAEKNKCILVASNLLKNNYESFLNEINILIEDVKTKYPVNGKLYLAGFSGGARMALSFGQRNIVNGVIACGALATTNQIITVRAPVYALIGMQDFNFIETAQYFFRPENTPGNLRIEISDEMHAWPSEKELTEAITYLILDADPDSKKCLDEKKLLEELNGSKMQQIEKFRKAGNHLNAQQIAKNMVLLHSKEDNTQFQSLKNSIEFGGELNDELNSLRESIRFELSVRDAYMAAFLTEDISWWENEISSLNQNIRKDKDRYRNLAYKRIKAFLGIMCYTITEKTLRSKDLENANKLLSVYKLIEPENPDMLYFYALYYSETGNTKEAKSNLQKAIEAGFSNQKMIESIGL